MIKQTENIDIVEPGLLESGKLNVFFNPVYIGSILGNTDTFFYLYSDDFIIPVKISNRGVFKYAHLLTEPAHLKECDAALSLFIDEVCCYLRDVSNVQWISETPAAALFKEAPNASKAIPFGSHIINLENDVDTLWSKVHSKHRNVIKKAEKEGVQIVKGISDEILNDYHSIDIETWGRSNVKVSGVGHLKKQVEALGDNIIFYMAYKNNVPQAGAIFYYNQTMCYYMHGASRNHSFTGSSNLLHWIAIQDMKAAGVKRYSFVGCRINEDENSKYHGIQRFKERFGGELFEGRRFKAIFSPAMYNLYKVMVDVRMSISQRRLVRQRDTIDQEWHKWH